MPGNEIWNITRNEIEYFTTETYLKKWLDDERSLNLCFVLLKTFQKVFLDMKICIFVWEVSNVSYNKTTVHRCKFLVKCSITRIPSPFCMYFPSKQTSLLLKSFPSSHSILIWLFTRKYRHKILNYVLLR